MIGSIRERYEEYNWEPVAQRHMRSVYRLTREGHHVLYLKIYHPRSPLQMIRNLLAAKTQKEARMLYILYKEGINVPFVVNHLKCGSVSALVTRGIEGARPLWELDETSRVKIMLNMVLLLLQRGFYHQDLHIGNIMMDAKGDAYLVDVYNVSRLKKVKEKHALGMLSQVLMAHDSQDDELAGYLGGLPFIKDTKAVIKRARTLAEANRKSWVRGNVRRSLRRGSFSDKIGTSDYNAFVKRGVRIDLDNTIASHWENISSGVNILKFQDKTQLSKVDSYCVKTYARPKFSSGPYALRAWKGLLTLYFNDIPVPEPVAVVVFRDKSSMLITRYLDFMTLDKVFYHDYKDMDYEEKVKLLDDVGRLVGLMHSKGIYHADLKACNFLFDKDKGLFLVDTDRVVQSGSISMRRRLKNLIQLNTSIPLSVSRAARMRFIKAYSGLVHEDHRELFRKVWLLSRHREIVYTTAQGDRMETWD